MQQPNRGPCCFPPRLLGHLPRQVSPIDEKGTAGHERCFVRGEKEDRIGDLLGSAGTPNGMSKASSPQELSHPLGCAAVFDDIGLDVGGTNAIDTDTLGRISRGQRLCELESSGFGDIVGERAYALQFLADEGADRGQVHDCPLLLPEHVGD